MVGNDDVPGCEKRGQLDDGAAKVVSAPSGGRSAAGSSYAALPVHVSTASVSGPRGTAEPTSCDPDVNSECG